MYLINTDNNKIEKIKAKSFSELGFKEREHLQEWLAKRPESLGEELLIIQKEFDGFNDTRERLDLLAIDKDGSLVIIENKLDDSGKDVTWQAMKYASYCSSLSKKQVIDIYQNYLDKSGKGEKAGDKISDFFNGQDIEEISINQGASQRIIMIAANFRKEVTSTVLWLMNFNLRVQCFKTTPYQLNDQLFLNIEQIIPMKEAEEYSIKMAEKSQEDISSKEEKKHRHFLRREFWTQYIVEINKVSKLYQNISPSDYHWIGASSGVRGVGYNSVISKKYARVELYIDRAKTAEENEMIFDFLYQQKETIEEKAGIRFTWERLEGKRAYRVKYEDATTNVFNKDEWSNMTSFMVDGMLKMERGFRDALKEVNKTLKTNKGV
ncbi:DUF4268 domain-containing protein [Flammeovirga kamogawensis]|uniref:DUF4268 domain-containing protein n=1 Tax=Flammeovirga kamogawensis TaxID=373891 RepID=A0ABX8GSY1_9BACT|nr:DUF4268 domain-containing protein [Flammeovirga kamogawensis]MBB6463329.1 hypothetical protein [Flammeovirga kamogawensis]QWG06699.1 DUF4268 domain-containing protein [Flammeovirga kamogawensis]TRX68520.1 DUF4268 domain-containing protein [Flammeovirga kamogawensis]